MTRSGSFAKEQAASIGGSVGAGQSRRSQRDEEDLDSLPWRQHRRSAICAQVGFGQLNCNRTTASKTEDTRLWLSKAFRNTISCSELDDEALCDVVDACCLRRISAGSQVSQERHVRQHGSTWTSYELLVVETGKLRTAGRRVTAGSVVGDLAVLHDAAWVADLIADGPTTVWSVDRNVVNAARHDAAVRRRTSLENILDCIPAVAHLGKEDRGRLVDGFEIIRFQAYDVIIGADTRHSALYLILQGEVVTEDDGILSLSSRTGGYIGEEALRDTMAQARRSFIAASPCVCAMLDRDAVQRLVGSLATQQERRSTRNPCYSNSSTIDANDARTCLDRTSCGTERRSSYSQEARSNGFASGQGHALQTRTTSSRHGGAQRFVDDDALGQSLDRQSEAVSCSARCVSYRDETQSNTFERESQSGNRRAGENDDEIDARRSRSVRRDMGLTPVQSRAPSVRNSCADNVVEHCTGDSLDRGSETCTRSSRGVSHSRETFRKTCEHEGLPHARSSGGSDSAVSRRSCSVRGDVGPVMQTRQSSVRSSYAEQIVGNDNDDDDDDDDDVDNSVHRGSAAGTQSSRNLQQGDTAMRKTSECKSQQGTRAFRSSGRHDEELEPRRSCDVRCDSGPTLLQSRVPSVRSSCGEYRIDENIGNSSHGRKDDTRSSRSLQCDVAWGKSSERENQPGTQSFRRTGREQDETAFTKSIHSVGRDAGLAMQTRSPSVRSSCAEHFIDDHDISNSDDSGTEVDVRSSRNPTQGDGASRTAPERNSQAHRGSRRERDEEVGGGSCSMRSDRRQTSLQNRTPSVRSSLADCFVDRDGPNPSLDRQSQTGMRSSSFSGHGDGHLTTARDRESDRSMQSLENCDRQGDDETASLKSSATSISDVRYEQSSSTGLLDHSRMSANTAFRQIEFDMACLIQQLNG
eukprot:TRINITY_DN15401_c0_g1_i4.p1 TRINITY_DN15401_c0_g1~~TRINITY_DN15401_c0_g1_i4.p1  ORF type:complete len:921 (-),score=130.53 TRINITY_DN15401_c0_g1_i4:59-2821(-)